MVPNITTIVLSFYGLVSLGIMHAIFFVLSKICPCINRLNRSIRRFLYFSGFLVFFMEGYMEYMMTSLISLKHIDWDTPFQFEMVNNVTTVIFIAAGALLPFLLVGFYIYKVKQWETEEFGDKYGKFIEGADVDRKE